MTACGFGILRYNALAFTPPKSHFLLMQPPEPDETNPGLQRARHQLRASGVKKTTSDPLRSGIHSRGYLPHVKHEGAAYFVTFRLADSLPKEALARFERDKSERLRRLDEFSR